MLFVGLFLLRHLKSFLVTERKSPKKARRVCPASTKYPQKQTESVKGAGEPESAGRDSLRGERRKEKRVEKRGYPGEMEIKQGSTSRQRRTTTHCHLERGPVNATGHNVIIHIRPKSLPFSIHVTMNVGTDYIFSSSIDSHRFNFTSKNMETWWRIGHWTALSLAWRKERNKGYVYILLNRMTKYKRGDYIFPPTIDISPDEADWYIGDLNQACLDEEKACTDEKNECSTQKIDCLTEKNALLVEYQACLDEKSKTEPTYFQVHGKFYNNHIFFKTAFSIN